MAMDDKKQEFNWGFLILASPFVALIVFVLVSFFVIFTQDNSKKEYLKKNTTTEPQWAHEPYFVGATNAVSNWKQGV